MIPKSCKRLAEVDFPIAEVSRHAVREKSIRHGHPSTLHLWWARRPLASRRAVLMVLLLPDCGVQRRCRGCRFGTRAATGAGRKTIEADDGLRRILLKFVANFANWGRGR